MIDAAGHDHNEALDTSATSGESDGERAPSHEDIVPRVLIFFDYA